MIGPTMVMGKQTTRVHRVTRRRNLPGEFVE
jgi:hypothetical protein